MASSSRLESGGKGKIRVTVDIRGRLGKIIKTVVVHRNDPENPVTTLSLTMVIRDRTHMGRYRAAEIFGEKCKGCHVDQGKG